nr:hypothetical protein [Tanacetum cinerariifolium]
MEKMIAKAILQERKNIHAQISLKIQKAIANDIPSQVDASVRSYMSGHILHVHPAQSQTNSLPEQQYQLYLSMKDNPQLQKQDIAIWLALQMKFGIIQVPQTTCRTSSVRPRDQDDPHVDAYPKGENSEKRQNTSDPVEDYSDIGSPEVKGPLSSDYVPGPEEPEHAPPSPVYLPYVPELVYPEYMPPKDDVFLAEEQPLPVTATPTADSPGYIPEFDLNGDPKEDEEENPEEDPADYPTDSTVVALPTVDHVPFEEVTEPLL